MVTDQSYVVTRVAPRNHLLPPSGLTNVEVRYPSVVHRGEYLTHHKNREGSAMRTMTRMATAAGLGLALLLGTAGVATANTCTPRGPLLWG